MKIPVYITTHGIANDSTTILAVTTDLDKAIEAAHAHIAGDEEFEEVMSYGDWVEDDLSNEPPIIPGEPYAVKVWKDGEFMDVVVEKWEVEVSQELLSSIISQEN